MLSGAVKSTGRGLHIHVAEDLYDVSHSHDVYGQDLIERLAAHQLINAKTLVAHGLYLSDADIAVDPAHSRILSYRSGGPWPGWDFNRRGGM